MRSPAPSYDELRERLAVAEETLGAIRGGEVDALVVQTDAGARVFTLEGADAFYRVLVEQMPLGVAGLHASGTILYANPRLAQMLGLPLERIVGARIRDFLPQPGNPTAGAGSSVSVDGLPAELSQLVRASGEQFPVEVSVAEVEGDATASVCMIVADVSERALAAAERARLAAIVEASDDAIMSLTPAGVIETWNEGAVKLYGYSPDEAIGRPAARLFGSDAAERESLLASVAAGAGPAAVEARDVRKDGSQVDVSVTDSSIRDADGCVIGIARIARDISTLKQSEQALRAAEASAAAARDRALEATRAKSEFLANVSHELRTPLNGVIGMTELLLDTELGAEQRDYAELAQASGRALLQLVGDVLDLAKIEAGRLTLERSEFDLLDAVEQVCELEAQPARQKGLELVVAIDADVPALVWGDELRLRQVLRNLVSNAVKFTEAGDVVVSVARAHDGRALLRFEVRDTGIGIEPERLLRLFEPFTQADSATPRRYGGTGLGLAIVKQLVELMGGQIDAHSTPAEGSSFEFTLPLEAAEPAQPDADATGRLGGMRLLVADGNPNTRHALAQQTIRSGATPVTAAREGDALTLLRQAAKRGEPLDAVLLDARLPGLDAAALTQLAADAALGSPRLILLGTALADRALARDADVEQFVLKPARRRRLEAALGGQAPSARPERPAIRRARPLAGARVLVAEDNEVNQLLAVRMLEKRGISADVAATGRAALAALERQDYDAVLMDCQMPELDGYETTRRLRRSEPAGRRVPVIAMTAHALHDDAARCLAIGMDDYLAKPLEPATFDAVLSRWIKPGAAQRRPPRPPAQAGAPPLLDETALATLRAELGDPHTIRQLLESFIRDSDERVEQLSRALAAGELDAANQLAHRIKGGALPLGAALLAALCQQLETATDPDAARALSGQLRDTYAATRRALLAAPEST